MVIWFTEKNKTKTHQGLMMFQQLETLKINDSLFSLLCKMLLDWFRCSSSILCYIYFVLFYVKLCCEFVTTQKGTGQMMFAFKAAFFQCWEPPKIYTLSRNVTHQKVNLKLRFMYSQLKDLPSSPLLSTLQHWMPNFCNHPTFWLICYWKTSPFLLHFLFFLYIRLYKVVL